MKLSDFKGNVIEDSKHSYIIGFINNNGVHDETAFVADSFDELEWLFNDFCEDNGFTNDTVEYVELTETTYRVCFNVRVEDDEVDGVLSWILNDMLDELDGFQPGVLNVGNCFISEVHDYEI